ncbi:MAG: M48 family metallopeptidase [Malacoplasma sp.]|nr:M48 family metallopeptidase [Malacoplasma sp.]
MIKKIKCHIVINDKFISYWWFLSPNKTKSITASINDKQEIIVKTPIFADKQSVEEFLIKVYPNLLKKIILKSNNKYYNPNNDFIKILGKHYPLIINVNQSKSTYKVLENSITLNLKDINDKELVLKRLLSKKTKEIVIPMAMQKANQLNLKVNKWGVRDTKRAWGYTKFNSKSIYFCYKLVVFEPEIILYVIFHELCHLVYPNHSKEFWNLLNKIYPQYKICKKILKTFF